MNRTDELTNGGMEYNASKITNNTNYNGSWSWMETLTKHIKEMTYN